jgi:hypothetical protein
MFLVRIDPPSFRVSLMILLQLMSLFEHLLSRKAFIITLPIAVLETPTRGMKLEKNCTT